MRVLDGVDQTPLQRADAEVAAAEALAAEARARARELRGKVGLPDEPAIDEVEDANPEASTPDPETVDQLSAGNRSRWARPTVATVVATAAILVSAALLAAGSYMVWNHRLIQRDEQTRAEFAAAASQAVITLMSIDSTKAEDNVKQIIANSTGQFRDDFQSEADDFVRTAHDSKAETKATVGSSAVESMTMNSAVVLVSASTTVSNSAGANQQPRNWRLSVTMVEDGDQLKLSKVEFVP